MGIGVPSWRKSERGVKFYIHLLLLVGEEKVELYIYSSTRLHGVDKDKLIFLNSKYSRIFMNYGVVVTTHLIKRSLK
jgi:hypothetical protein